MGIGVTSQRLKGINNFIRLATCSIVIMCAIPSKLGGFFDGESIYAIILASLTLAFCILAISYREMIGSNMFYILMALALLWVVEASLVTFRGPFFQTGNGYFASWGAAFLCIAMAAQK
jgi:O-antigen ligase